MENYKVLLYPRAYQDIEEIYGYIAVQKLSPENAAKQTDRIWQALNRPKTDPKAHQYRQEGRYAGKEYRQLLIDHYLAVYRIDEESRTVYVVTVQYQGRNI